MLLILLNPLWYTGGSKKTLLIIFYKTCSYWYIISFWRFIYLLERETDFQRKKEISHQPVGSPNGHNSQRCSSLEPGAQKSIQVSHVGGRVLVLGPFPHCFPRHICRKVDKKQSSQNLNQHPDMTCWYSKLWLGSAPPCLPQFVVILFGKQRMAAIAILHPLVHPPNAYSTLYYDKLSQELGIQSRAPCGWQGPSLPPRVWARHPNMGSQETVPSHQWIFTHCTIYIGHTSSSSIAMNVHRANCT